MVQQELEATKEELRAERQAAEEKLANVQAAAKEKQAAADELIRKLKEENERLKMQSSPGPSTHAPPATRFRW